MGVLRMEVTVRIGLVVGLLGKLVLIHESFFCLFVVFFLFFFCFFFLFFLWGGGGVGGVLFFFFFFFFFFRFFLHKFKNILSLEFESTTIG